MNVERVLVHIPAHPLTLTPPRAPSEPPPSASESQRYAEARWQSDQARRQLLRQHIGKTRAEIADMQRGIERTKRDLEREVRQEAEGQVGYLNAVLEREQARIRLLEIDIQPAATYLDTSRRRFIEVTGADPPPDPSGPVPLPPPGTRIAPPRSTVSPEWFRHDANRPAADRAYYQAYVNASMSNPNGPLAWAFALEHLQQQQAARTNGQQVGNGQQQPTRGNPQQGGGGQQGGNTQQGVSGQREVNSQQRRGGQQQPARGNSLQGGGPRQEGNAHQRGGGQQQPTRANGQQGGGGQQGGNGQRANGNGTRQQAG